tara:strand:+ start:2447 stop:4135 length:1689 start_codon:yes stop_codon:yes gene_type:complete
MSKKKETLYCYLRVSSKVQEEEGHSIENQRFHGERVSKKLGMKYKEFNEGHYSTTSKSRPKLQEIKEGMRIGRVKNIWYYSRSRWTRDEIEDGLIRRNYFQKYKVNVYEGESGQKRKYNTPQERFLDSIFTTVQQFDREQRREVSISGKRHLSRTLGDTGVFMGGTINFGFSNVDRKWVINKEEEVYVKKIFQMYLQGKSLKDIKSYLDSQGIKPRRSNTWNLGTLNTMLRNRVYVGEFKWGSKDPVSKEVEETFTIVVPQIISHSLFNRVQKKIKENTKNFGNNMRKYESLLTNLLVCCCGENITGQVKKTLNHKSYGCRSKFSLWRGKEVKDCDNTRTMDMDKTDGLIVDKVQEIVGSSSLLKERFKTDVMKKRSLESSEISLEKKKLERHINLLDEQIELSVKSISTNEVNKMLKKVDKRIYNQISKNLEEELSQLDDRKKGLIKEIDDLDNKKDWIDWVGKYGDDIKTQFKKVNGQLLEGIIEEIVVTPTFGKNRDGKRVQVGHKFNVHFKLPIVDDKVVYKDKSNKSKGYNVIDGVNDLWTEELMISKGGRPKKNVI